MAAFRRSRPEAATSARAPPSGEDVLCQIGLGRACAVAPWGEVDAGHPLGRASVGPGARRAGDGERDVLLQGGVPGRVKGGVGLPAAPQDPAPGASDGP
jgi:hypothetical protein